MFRRARTTPAMSGGRQSSAPSPSSASCASGTACTSRNVLGDVDSGALPQRLEASSAPSGPYVPSRNIEKLFVETAVATGAIHQVHFEDPVTYVAGAVFSPHRAY